MCVHPMFYFILRSPAQFLKYLRWEAILLFNTKTDEESFDMMCSTQCYETYLVNYLYEEIFQQ